MEGVAFEGRGGIENDSEDFSLSDREENLDSRCPEPASKALGWGRREALGFQSRC